jgi:hypothetical protein
MNLLDQQIARDSLTKALENLPRLGLDKSQGEQLREAIEKALADLDRGNRVQWSFAESSCSKYGDASIGPIPR